MRFATRSVAALFTLVLLAAQAFAAVGTIDSFEGEVRVATAGTERTAQAGLGIEEGDTVITGANAWALLAMVDGASITLRPSSRLRIDSYRYGASAPATDNVSAISLLQGAFRSITGLIGQTNRQGYRVVTPSATIGIRGTDHEPAYFPASSGAQRIEHEPGTYDKVTRGESFIRNARGEVAVKPGQTAFVHHDGRSRPALLKRPPRFYRQHAQLDRRAATSREAFHRRFNEGRPRRDDDKAKGKQERAGNAQEKQDAAQKARREQQEQRREEQQKRAEERRQERASQREARKERQHEAPQKRHRE